MKSLLFLAAGWLLPTLLSAQTGKSQSLPARIAAARQELQLAFVADDPAAAALWIDSLARLENSTYAGLIWDERWLLYFWEEAYGNMFDEVMRFDAAERERQAYKIAPPADSLFETLDLGLYERRFDMFNRLQQALLNEEEKAFCVLQLDYLLRLNKDEKEWTARLDAFLKRYPTSRCADFVRSIRPALVTPRRRGYGFSVSYLQGDWTGPLDRSLRPLYGASASFYLWRKGWHFEATTVSGQPALGRQVDHNGFDWLKGDGSYFRTSGLEVGRDVLESSRLRITPAVGAFFSSLSPAPPGNGENPDYYSEFYFSDIHFTTALTADVKLFRKDRGLQGVEKGTFHGLRLRVGYHWMRLGRQNSAFDGNLFFFALGYHLFVQRPSK